MGAVGGSAQRLAWNGLPQLLLKVWTSIHTTHSLRACMRFSSIPSTSYSNCVSELLTPPIVGCSTRSEHSGGTLPPPLWLALCQQKGERGCHAPSSRYGPTCSLQPASYCPSRFAHTHTHTHTHAHAHAHVHAHTRTDTHTHTLSLTCTCTPLHV
jgi:ABC-type nickel/cobalt efflux system permease component RcnA